MQCGASACRDTFPGTVPGASQEDFQGACMPAERSRGRRHDPLVHQVQGIPQKEYARLARVQVLVPAHDGAGPREDGKGDAAGKGEDLILRQAQGRGPQEARRARGSQERRVRRGRREGARRCRGRRDDRRARAHGARSRRGVLLGEERRFVGPVPARRCHGGGSDPGRVLSKVRRGGAELSHDAGAGRAPAAGQV